MAQRYGTIAAHTRSRASVLFVFVVFCVHMYSFAGLIRRTPPPTFRDTAITDRHSDTPIFQLRAHWVRIFWSIGSEKSFGHVPPVGAEPSTSCVQDEHPIHYARLSATFYWLNQCVCVCIPILVKTFPEWLIGTEPLPHTPGAVRPSSLCL